MGRPALDERDWEAAENFLIRFAASMTISRPQLASLTPGRPRVRERPQRRRRGAGDHGRQSLSQPFRSTNFDLSFERISDERDVRRDFFYKDLESFPQRSRARRRCRRCSSRPLPAAARRDDQPTLRAIDRSRQTSGRSANSRRAGRDDQGPVRSTSSRISASSALRSKISASRRTTPTSNRL